MFGLYRLDAIILFRRLPRSEKAATVETQLEHLRKPLADRETGWELDRSALGRLSSEGCDSTYGTRPLKRVIQRDPQKPLTQIILGGSVCDGDTVHVSAGAEGEGDRAATLYSYPPGAARGFGKC